VSSLLLPKLIKPSSVWHQSSVLAGHHCSLLPQVAFFSGNCCSGLGLRV
jgi:hypothetical protein